jgi:hypothetical protein
MSEDIEPQATIVTKEQMLQALNVHQAAISKIGETLDSLDATVATLSIVVNALAEQAGLEAFNVSQGLPDE